MGFELSYGDIGILFFLTLGPLKAILPFARMTRETGPAFQRTVAWQATAIATAIVVVVALSGPLVLTNGHVSPPAIIITGGIILFNQALLGLALISCGILALVISLWQYRWTLRYMWGEPFTPIAGVTQEGRQTPIVAVAIVLIFIGLFAFFAVLLRLG
jgi:hypothetical protein